MTAKNKKHKNSAVDIAYWLTVRLMRNRAVPSVQQIANVFECSRATSYRWHDWAKNKQSELSV